MFIAEVKLNGYNLKIDTIEFFTTTAHQIHDLVDR